MQQKYNKELDKEIGKEEVEIGNKRLTARIMQYNEGQKKLQIGQEYKDKDGEWKFTKIGRMTKEEAEALIEIAEKSIKSL